MLEVRGQLVSCPVDVTIVTPNDMTSTGIYVGLKFRGKGKSDPQLHSSHTKLREEEEEEEETTVQTSVKLT